MNTPARSKSRAAARLAAVQALYQRQMEETHLARLLDEFHQHRLGREIEDVRYADAEVDFFDDVVSGVIARRSAGAAMARELLALDRTRATLESERVKLVNDIRNATSLVRLGPVVSQRLGLRTPPDAQRSPQRATAASRTWKPPDGPTASR